MPECCVATDKCEFSVKIFLKDYPCGFCLNSDFSLGFSL